jgi:hypothetical protein
MMTILTLAGLLYLAACHTRSALHDVPAVITNPTGQSRAELYRVVSSALNGAPLTIADDALTRDSTLIIEREGRHNADGVPLTGRDRGRPEQFRLVKNGSRCMLVHERSGQRFTLAAVTCSPKREPRS